jgi:hypothetical protein
MESELSAESQAAAWVERNRHGLAGMTHANLPVAPQSTGD